MAPYINKSMPGKHIIYTCNKNNNNNNNIMSNRNELIIKLLSGITMSELQNLVNIREEANRPIPAPRRNVQQLIQYFEDNPIPPFKPIPAPRTRNNDQYQPLGPK